jgi:hypothetical protein
MNRGTNQVSLYKPLPPLNPSDIEDEVLKLTTLNGEIRDKLSELDEKCSSLSGNIDNLDALRSKNQRMLDLILGGGPLASEDPPP